MSTTIIVPPQTMQVTVLLHLREELHYIRAKDFEVQYRRFKHSVEEFSDMRGIGRYCRVQLRLYSEFVANPKPFLKTDCVDSLFCLATDYPDQKKNPAADRDMRFLHNTLSPMSENVTWTAFGTRSGNRLDFLDFFHNLRIFVWKFYSRRNYDLDDQAHVKNHGSD